MPPAVRGHRLRRRLAIAFTGLAAAVALFVSAGFWASEHFIEEATLEDRLVLEMDRFMASGAPSRDAELLGPHMRYYRRAAGTPFVLPGNPSPLTPGIYERQDEQGQDETVLVRATDDGGTAALVFVDEQAGRRRRWLAISIVAGLAAAASISLWLAGRLAQQTLAPLDNMVATLAMLDPELRGQRMPPVDADSELQVITEALNSYTQRLDEVVNRERAFASAASHELRTPLAVIQSSIEILAAQGLASPHVERIQRAAQNAARDLETLLWLSRATGHVPGEQVALHEVLVSLCADQVDVSRIRWALAPCDLVAPPGALAVIVTNLLRNALRASPVVGSVVVTLTADALLVSDAGPGVPDHVLSSLALPGVSYTDGGSGMGLYIASVLSRRLGWQLLLVNREEGGLSAQLRFTG